MSSVDEIIDRAMDLATRDDGTMFVPQAVNAAEALLQVGGLEDPVRAVLRVGLEKLIVDRAETQLRGDRRPRALR
jgi:hypothetical protein